MSLRDPMPSYIIAGAKRSLARGGAPAAGGPEEAAAAGNVPSHSHRQPSSPIKEEEEREEGRTSGGGGLRQQQQRQGARQSALLAPPPSLPGTQPPPFAMTSMPAYPSYYKRCGSYFKCSLTLRVCVCHNFLPEGLPTCTVSSILLISLPREISYFSMSPMQRLRIGGRGGGVRGWFFGGSVPPRHCLRSRQRRLPTLLLHPLWRGSRGRWRSSGGGPDAPDSERDAAATAADVGRASDAGGVRAEVHRDGHPFLLR